MIGSLSPEQRQQLMAGYVLYDLSAEESAILEALLVEHPDLQSELAQLQAAWEAAWEIAPQAPPDHLRRAILQVADLPSADRGNSPIPQGVLPLAPRPASPWWQRGLGAVAAMVIAGLSISNLVLWRALQVAQSSNGETLTVALADPTGMATATAEVQINPQTLEGSLTVANLPPLEPGTVYVLWTVVDPNAPVTVDDKNAILTTVFTVDEQGRQSQPIDLPSIFRRDGDRVRAIAITQESAVDPQAHRSAPILIQPL